MKTFIATIAFFATIVAQSQTNTPGDMSELMIRYMIQEDYYPKAPDSLFTLDWKDLTSRLDEYTGFKNSEMSATRNDLLIGSQVKGVTGMRLSTKDSSVVVVKVWKDGPAYNEGIGIGDTVVAVNGTPVKSHKVASDMIRGEIGSKVTVTMARQGKRFDVQLERSVVKVSTAMGKKQGKTLKMKVFMFSEGVSDSIAGIAARLGTTGIDTVILDLRGNSGGLLSEGEKMASLFVNVGDTVLTYKKRKSEHVVVSEDFNPLQKVRNIIILIDSGTASSAEIVAGALKVRRGATIIGTKSFGKGVIQQVRDVDDGTFTMTIAEYFAGGVMKIQGVGIVPDVNQEAKKANVGKTVGIDLKKVRKENPFPSFDAMKKIGVGSDAAEYIWGDLGVFEVE